MITWFQYWIKNRGSSADSIHSLLNKHSWGFVVKLNAGFNNTRKLRGLQLPKKYKQNMDSRIEGPSLKASKFYLYFSSTWIPLYLQLSDVAQRRQSELLSPLRSWVQFLLLYDSCHLCDKNQSTLCQKSWVFSGCSGFLPQGKLTGCVRINTVRKLISQLL